MIETKVQYSYFIDGHSIAKLITRDGFYYEKNNQSIPFCDKIMTALGWQKIAENDAKILLKGRKLLIGITPIPPAKPKLVM